MLVRFKHLPQCPDTFVAGGTCSWCGHVSGEPMRLYCDQDEGHADKSEHNNLALPPKTLDSRATRLACRVCYAARHALALEVVDALDDNPGYVLTWAPGIDQRHLACMSRTLALLGHHHRNSNISRSSSSGAVAVAARIEQAFLVLQQVFTDLLARAIAVEQSGLHPDDIAAAWGDGSQEVHQALNSGLRVIPLDYSQHEIDAWRKRAASFGQQRYSPAGLTSVDWFEPRTPEIDVFEKTPTAADKDVPAVSERPVEPNSSGTKVAGFDDEHDEDGFVGELRGLVQQLSDKQTPLAPPALKPSVRSPPVPRPADRAEDSKEDTAEGKTQSEPTATAVTDQQDQPTAGNKALVIERMCLELGMTSGDMQAISTRLAARQACPDATAMPVGVDGTDEESSK